jgi:hypothetical protein
MIMPLIGLVGKGILPLSPVGFNLAFSALCVMQSSWSRALSALVGHIKLPDKPH